VSDAGLGDLLPCQSQHKLPLEVFDYYIMKGGHQVFNVYLDGSEVITGEPGFHYIYNRPHYFRQRA
jgi:hypothetical protein